MQRAEDLAARYQTSIRTIYRDVRALCEAGIPVVSLPGSGYALPRDFFLPPLSLGLEEAAAMLLGIDYVRQTLDPAYAAAAVDAGRKIEAIVPLALREPLAEARRAMRLVGTAIDAAELERVRILRAAIAERRILVVRYRGQRTDDPAGTGQSPRRIAPYGLAHMRGAWYVIGHSYERAAVRRFRLSRIAELNVTGERFTLPADFALGPPSSEPDFPLLVRVAFGDGDLGAMHERLRSFDATIEAVGPGFVAAFRAHSEATLATHLMSWGDGIRVLEPLTLRDRVVAHARRIIDMHS